jgi:hypothetical protein
MALSEKRFILVVTISVLVATSLPYAFGHLTEPPDRQFMGVLLDVPDYGQYMSWFREFQRANLIENKLTPEPNDPIFFNLLWWVMGRLHHYTELGFPVLHELLRLCAGLTFLVALYMFCALVLPEPKVRRVAFLFAVFAAGFGWLLILMKYTVTKGELLFPLDVYIPEPNSFLCLMAFPHFILANALILIVFGLVIIGYKKRRLRYAAAAGVVGLILALQHAYDLLILYGILGMFTFLVTIRDRQISWFLVKSNLIVGLISWWPGIYSVWLTQANHIWKEVLAQYSNAGVYTPTPFHLIVLMGLPLLIAALTFEGLFPLNKKSDELLFVNGWLLAGFVILYVPTDFQVHMLNSWQIPVSILAASGLFKYVIPLIQEYLKEAKPRWNPQLVVRSLTVGVVLIASLTNLYLFLWRFVDLARYDYPYYLYRDEVAAMNWLEKNTEPKDIVLSSYTMGHYIPALTGKKAFLAHWAQTVDFYDKRDRVLRFFDVSTGDLDRVETLYAFGVDYIFHGPAERALGAYDPGTAPWLALAFSAPQVNVYRVKGDQLAQDFASDR